MSRSSEYTYTPAWWVPGAHLRTLWGKLARRPPVPETRVERWTTPDDDELELRRIDAPPSAPSSPHLLVLHGLEGTIRSHYLAGLLARASALGWAADALIFRTCNGVMTRAPRLYHSGETTDLDFVVRRLVHDHPDRPLLLAGFSLGGNVLLKWLGEQGDSAPARVRGAVAVSVPYDLERGSRHIERGFARVYTRQFMRTLRDKASAKLATHPGLFDAAALARARTLFEFDDAVTAPVHGFAGARDYYERSSSLQFLGDIRRPTLLLSAYEFFTDKCLARVQRHRKLRSPFEAPSGCYVLMEAEGKDAAEVEGWLGSLFEKGLVTDGTMAQSPTQATELWALRESISESLSATGLPHKNDVSLPVSNLEAFCSELDAVFRERYPGWEIALFGHIGDGNLHINIMKPDDMEKAEFLAHTKKADPTMFELVRKHGGSISAEHGIGLLKKDYLSFSRSPAELDMLRTLKRALDPNNILNPGKILDV